jgi:hypothetical protein
VPVVTRFPTQHTPVSTGWTNPENADASDDAYALSPLSTMNAGGTHSGDFHGFGFDSVIPAGATILSVTVEAEWKNALAASGYTFGLLTRVNNANRGTETTDTTNPTTDTIRSQNPGALTRADLLDAALKVRVRRSRAALVDSPTAVEGHLDMVRVTVRYVTRVEAAAVALAGDSGVLGRGSLRYRAAGALSGEGALGGRGGARVGLAPGVLDGAAGMAGSGRFLPGVPPVLAVSGPSEFTGHGIARFLPPVWDREFEGAAELAGAGTGGTLPPQGGAGIVHLDPQRLGADVTFVGAGSLVAGARPVELGGRVNALGAGSLRLRIAGLLRSASALLGTGRLRPSAGDLDLDALAAMVATTDVKGRPVFADPDLTLVEANPVALRLVEANPVRLALAAANPVTLTLEA